MVAHRHVQDAVDHPAPRPSRRPAIGSSHRHRDLGGSRRRSRRRPRRSVPPSSPSAAFDRRRWRWSTSLTPVATVSHELAEARPRRPSESPSAGRRRRVDGWPGVGLRTGPVVVAAGGEADRRSERRQRAQRRDAAVRDRVRRGFGRGYAPSIVPAPADKRPGRPCPMAVCSVTVAVPGRDVVQPAPVRPEDQRRDDQRDQDRAAQRPAAGRAGRRRRCGRTRSRVASLPNEPPTSAGEQRRLERRRRASMSRPPGCRPVRTRPAR